MALDYRVYSRKYDQHSPLPPPTHTHRVVKLNTTPREITLVRAGPSAYRVVSSLSSGHVATCQITEFVYIQQCEFVDLSPAHCQYT